MYVPLILLLIAIAASWPNQAFAGVNSSGCGRYLESKGLTPSGQERDALAELLKRSGSEANAIARIKKTTMAQNLPFQIQSFDEAIEVAYLMLNEFKDHELEPKQRQTLNKHVKLHASDIKLAQDGRKSLAKLSQRNLKRELISGHKNLPHKVNRQIEDIVQQLEPFFVHNTVNRSFASALPLLSSEALESLGLPPGLNTFHFNRSFLETQDMVFFFVRYKSKDSPIPGDLKSTYGEAVVHLSHSYAQDWGMVSPYIMQPFELARYLEQKNPRLAQQFQSQVIDTNGNDEGWDSIDSTLKMKVLSELGQHDFTLPDFVRWLQHHLFKHLANIYIQGGQESLNQQLKTLTSEADWTPYIQREILKPLGFRQAATSMELKIPIAVPASQYQVESNKTQSSTTSLGPGFPGGHSFGADPSDSFF